MSLDFIAADEQPTLIDTTIFLSASIPDPARWDGPADALAITDAVVSLARVFLTAGARIVTAAHPTIAPLLLYVAAELPAETPRRIVTYQSELFEDILPAATQRFRDEGIGEFIWTEAAHGDTPDPAERAASLKIMRERMLAQTNPSAAVFIGGMAGIADEYSMFTERFPEAPVYPLGSPGGEARRLVEHLDSPLASQLRESRVYPALWRTVLADLTARQNS
jgi:SLOG cluster3 family